MRRSVFQVTAVFALALSLCLLVGCPMPVTPLAGGSLTITVADRVSRTLLPAVSMQPASYSISGTGPNGTSFTQSTSSGSLTLSALAFGTWTVTVNALNSDGTLVGQGFGSAEVHTASTTTLAISVTPLAGSGTLSLSVSWPSSQVESPSVQATLLDHDGTLTPLPFTVSGSQASFSSAPSLAIFGGALGDACACSGVGPRGQPVVFGDQTNIVIWDEVHQTEHFIRNASFRSGAADFGFIAPTPGKPQLNKASNRAFYTLAALAPVIQFRGAFCGEGRM